MTTRVLITGAEGYVGQRLAAHLRDRFVVIGTGRRGTADLTCDLEDERATADAIRQAAPDIIIHAAGNKNLGACEQQPAVAYAANVTTTLNVLNGSSVPVLYISTDYVFCGAHGGYTETSPLSPLTAYGRSKMWAETIGRRQAPTRFTAIRVSALYDADSTFVRLLSRELSAGRPVDCFVDAYYSPTWFEDFAAMMARLITEEQRPSVIHVAGPTTTRYAFARSYARVNGFDAELVRRARLQPGSTIFPDLSLSSVVAGAYGFTPTPHDTALAHLAAAALTEKAA